MFSTNRAEDILFCWGPNSSQATEIDSLDSLGKVLGTARCSPSPGYRDGLDQLVADALTAAFAAFNFALAGLQINMEPEKGPPQQQVPLESIVFWFHVNLFVGEYFEVRSVACGSILSKFSTKARDSLGRQVSLTVSQSHILDLQ